METLDLLKELGFDSAHKAANDKLERCRKLHVAYNNFEFIPMSAVDSFNVKLKDKTECYFDSEMKKKISKKEAMKGTRGNKRVYDKLVFKPVKDYGQIPPVEALQKMKCAAELKCFDSFEVAKIESVVEVVDPIIFGRINGCSDLFMVAQWDHDIKFEDLKKEVNNGLW